MSKALDAFQRITCHCTSDRFDEYFYTIRDDFPEEVNLIEHTLTLEVLERRALEIIKKYQVDMKVIMYCVDNNIDYAEYVDRELWVDAQDSSPMCPMSQEEFDLLKEVLK